MTCASHAECNLREKHVKTGDSKGFGNEKSNSRLNLIGGDNDSKRSS